MKTFVSFISGLVIFNFLLGSCHGSVKRTKPDDTPNAGTISVSIDESFRPVMEEQISMYQALFPNTRIIAQYKSEADCFRDLFKDSSNRLVITARGLSREEEEYMTGTLGYNPGCRVIASDAVALIVNASNMDTTFTLDELKDLMTGKSIKKNTMVFDGLNATSTVRYIKDSILHGSVFDTSCVKAASGSQAVIDYVSRNPHSIGLVGISWIGNPEDSTQLKLLEKVKICYLRCDFCTDKPYVKPMQESVITGRYPLVRHLYYINKENYKGLGTGFTSFLKYERGQLIFKRAYLAPVMDFEVRNVRINRNLTEN